MNAFAPCFLTLCSALVCFEIGALGQSGPPPEAFKPYASCSLANGPAVVETTPLPAGVKSRTVTTFHGPYQVAMSQGFRVMFAYPGEDFYANLKIEELPADSYAGSKAALIEEFDRLLATSDDARNYSVKPQLSGFDVRGQDRSKREGGVLGVYLLFDDPTKTVVTIYFLNQEPPKQFQTMAQYGELRDRFLVDYTACVRKGLGGPKDGR